MYDIFLPSVTVNEPSLKETEQPPSVSTATEGICFSSFPRYVPNMRYVSPVPQSHVVTAKRRPYVALPALETFTVIAFEFEKCPKFANVFLLFNNKQEHKTSVLKAKFLKRLFRKKLCICLDCQILCEEFAVRFYHDKYHLWQNILL